MGLYGQWKVAMKSRSSTMAITILIAFALLVPSLPLASSFPYDPYIHSSLRIVGTWKDPGGGGEDLRFRVSTDGTRLLMLGYGAPDEVRISDLDTGNATILEPPVPGYDVIGCDWNEEEDQVVVWGGEGGGPLIVVYDLPTGNINDSVEWIDLIDLASVSEVSHLASDIIVSVAGRDANGTSHLLFLEVEQQSIRRDHVWEGNHTIIEVENEGGDLVILDTGNTVTVQKSSDWSTFNRTRGALQGGPVSWHVPYGQPHGIGDASGRVVFATDFLVPSENNVTVASGPVTGFSWSFGRSRDFVVSSNLPGGGSKLAGWELEEEGHHRLSTVEMCSIEIEGQVTMMLPDPRGWSQVLVALDDGTLMAVQYDIRPSPIEIKRGMPDMPDGRGLEPFISWFPGGTSIEPRFYL
jgi:hypothetical protein